MARMTVKEHLQRIPDEGVRKQALQNMNNTRAFEKLDSLSDALDKGFEWGTTQQGSQFWKDIYNKLRNAGD